EISAPGFGPDAKADQWSVSYSGVCLNYDVDPNMYQSFSQTPGCDLTNLYRSSKLKGNDFTQSPEQANFLLSAAEEAFDGVLSTK
ncbi:MAG TPA: hypothetical protein VLF63_02495, partial [Patescibacteria group bacterium]|nr:hypothetical protein [Patescibacteria group bacterium]